MTVGFPARSRDAAIELGDDPPLVAGAGSEASFDRRSVSMRWLAGTILTAVISTTLMGGALLGALDGRYVVQSPPVALMAKAGGSAKHDGEHVEKSDQLQQPAWQPPDRRTIEVNTVTLVGDRRLIRKRPYTLVSTSLITSEASIRGNLPAFDPLKIFSDTKLFPMASVSDAIYDAPVDGEITVAIRDFPTGRDFKLAPEAEITTAEVEAELQQQRFDGQEAVEFASTGLAFDHRFDFGFAIPSEDEDSRIRIASENVSELSMNHPLDPALSGDEAASEDPDDVMVVVANGETLRDILETYGVADAPLDAVLDVFERDAHLAALTPGQTVHMELARSGFADAAVTTPVRVSVYDGESHVATVAITDDDTYVAAPPPEPSDRLLASKAAPEAAPSGPMPTIYDSFYQTALEQDVPEELIEDLVHAFSFEVDFKSRVRAGDRFTILYSGGDAEAKVPEVLFTSLKAGGIEHRYYRYRDPADELVRLYDEEGRSAQKFLMRKPVSQGVVTSPFGWRKHPTFGRQILHSGVDYGAPRGTPIHAAGDGVIEEMQWKGGYGRFTLLKHSNGYETAYAHQVGWAKGLKAGDRVRQGQVIGYVGSTGNSTGNHVHFEIRANGRPVDPLRIRLPRDHELDGETLASFEEERARIDALVAGDMPRPLHPIAVGAAGGDGAG